MRIGRLVTGLLMVAAAGTTYLLEATRQMFGLTLSIGAGTALLLLLGRIW